MDTKPTFPHLLDTIGNTPLITLEHDYAPTILAKLEYTNPGGSIKDRSARFMIEQAERDGLLKPGGTIVEASSGNQGIALAMIGAVKGYKVVITVPDRTSTEKISTLRAYGAQVYICPDTDNLEDPEGYHAKAKELKNAIPGSFMPNQYFNYANAKAHYATTGPEIWRQTKGTITHLVVGAGSCGTISGTGRYLKEQNPNVKIIGVDAATSAYSSKNPEKYNVEGIGIDVISETLDESVIDVIVPITDADAFRITRKLAAQGILAGLSSGAVMHVAEQYARQLGPDDVMVLIFGDSGRAYLSKIFAVPFATPTTTSQAATTSDTHENLNLI